MAGCAQREAKSSLVLAALVIAGLVLVATEETEELGEVEQAGEAHPPSGVFR